MTLEKHSEWLTWLIETADAMGLDAAEQRETWLGCWHRLLADVEALEERIAALEATK